MTLSVAVLLAACSPPLLRSPQHQSSLSSLRKTRPGQLLVMTLNLHTWQEKDPQAKLDLVADLIALLDIDLIALQECAQHQDSPYVEGMVRSDNMALNLCRRLQQVHHREYYYYWDWAHYGWNVWEEGVAVLSRYPLTDTASRVLSTANDPHLIDTRKAVSARTVLPSGNPVQILSAHLSWRKTAQDQEANRQAQALLDWASETRQPGSLQLVCGDFNARSTLPAPYNEVYTLFTNAGWQDSFLSINPRASHIPPSSRYDTIEEGGRIDYIWVQGTGWQVVDSRLFFSFTDSDRVSDHRAVITLLQPAAR